MTVTVFLFKMVHVFTGTKILMLTTVHWTRTTVSERGVLHVVTTYIQRQDSNIVGLRSWQDSCGYFNSTPTLNPPAIVGYNIVYGFI